MVEKGIRGGIYHAVRRYAKVNNKYMKSYDDNKEILFLQPLLVGGFKRIKKTSRIDEDFIKKL